MKKISLLISSLAVISLAFSQQRPYFTQYVLNNYLVNPAVAGIDNYTDIKMSHRMQWVGLQDAPVTTYVTVNGPTKKKDYDVDRVNATSIYPRGRNLMLDIDPYQPDDAHSGMGFTMINDKTGPLSRFAAYGTYAYHINLNRNTNLSLGVSAGITQMSLDPSKLNFASGGDPATGSGTTKLNKINPDISAGLWLYSTNYFIGLSAQQIIAEKLYFTNYSEQSSAVQTKGKQIPHIFAQAGYKLNLNEEISLLPSVMLRYVNPLPLSFDLNTKVDYRDIVWAGASYRYQDGFAAMFGVNLNYCINIGYSYDLTTSNLNLVSKGTHEILVGFLIGNKYNDYFPRNAW